MDPAAKRIAADQSYDPEDEEDNRYSPKHFGLLRLFGIAAGRTKLTAARPSSCKVLGKEGRLPMRIKYELSCYE